MSVYLGFSCSQHDPSIAVVNEAGEVVFAEANERGLKCKRAWHAPPDALGLVEPLLDSYIQGERIVANLTWSRSAWATVGLLTRLSQATTAALEWLGPDARESRLWRAWTFRHALYRAPSSASGQLLNLELRVRERRGFRGGIIRRAWNHHLSHAATACFSSPFAEALCVVIDGMGEGSSTSIFRFRDGRLTRLDAPQLVNLASLGIFYSQACFAAGLDPLAGEEWKLMGLAAYGRLDEDLYRRMRSVLQVKNNALVQSKAYSEAFDPYLSRRTHPPGENANFAFTMQKVFEEVLFDFLTKVHARWGGENLVLTGGCALNSSANGKILQATPFRHLHVPMAPGDDGNAIGAALLAWQAEHKDHTTPRCASPYLGSSADLAALARLRTQGLQPCFVARHGEELTEWTAEELARGRIIGWMQGRAEFGPRALGHRSILADPRSNSIRDRLNTSVKFRESFRPFAPSILHEHGPAYFEDYVRSRYMERTLKWRPECAPPGVRHVDDTGRLQSVTAEDEPLFYALLSCFYRKTGLPILLNTSFNVMGRPMVHDIEDALGVFFTSDVDLLIIENFAFRKPGAT